MHFFISVQNANSFLGWGQSLTCYAYLVEVRGKSLCVILTSIHTFNLAPCNLKCFPAYKCYWFSCKWDTKYETYVMISFLATTVTIWRHQLNWRYPMPSSCCRGSHADLSVVRYKIRSRKMHPSKDPLAWSWKPRSTHAENGREIVEDPPAEIPLCLSLFHLCSWRECWGSLGRRYLLNGTRDWDVCQP